MTLPLLIGLVLAAALFLFFDGVSRAAGRTQARQSTERRLDDGAQIASARQTPEPILRRATRSPHGALAALEDFARVAAKEVAPRQLAIGATVGFGFGFGSGYVATGALGFAVPTGIAFAIATAIMMVGRARSVRRAKCDKQLPEALDMIMRALRAGHPVPSAIGAVARDLDAPLGTEFALATKEVAYGQDLDAAISNMAHRVGTDDMHMLSTVIRVQQRTGGNLVEVLARFGELMRERFRMRAKAMALSAEGRVSAVLLCALPFIMFVLINIVNPDYYLLVRGDPLVPVIFGFTFAAMAVGAFIIWRMVNFKI